MEKLDANILKKVVVLDGQGGGIGKSIISSVSSKCKRAVIVACATNEYAANIMKKAGADICVCGEEKIKKELRSADVVAGPIGIIIANALRGEITPSLAQSVADCSAVKLLIPLNKCNVCVAGIGDKTVSQNINEVADIIYKISDCE